MRTGQVALLVLVAFVAVSSALQREARVQATLSATVSSAAASDTLAEIRIKELLAQGTTLAHINSVYTKEELSAPELKSAKVDHLVTIYVGKYDTQHKNLKSVTLQSLDSIYPELRPFFTADEKNLLLVYNLDQARMVFDKVVLRYSLNLRVGVTPTAPTAPVSSAPPPVGVAPRTTSP